MGSMRRALAAVAMTAITLAASLVAATPSQAACGQMDFKRDPSTYVFLNWGTNKTNTWVEPHGGTQGMRAVLVRYYGSKPTYYYGSYKVNTVYQFKISHVSSSNGTWIANYYQSKASGNKLWSFYRDYPPRAGWTKGC